jgi:hypothetical protein
MIMKLKEEARAHGALEPEKKNKTAEKTLESEHDTDLHTQ